MLKRKYGDRSDWKRVVSREYAQTFIESEPFTGYVTLLSQLKVSDPLFVKYGDKQICIADDGYSWLQHFPSGQHHSVTTMFDSNGEIIQWYIDICSQNGVDENLLPWMEDLFLDLIVLPTGEQIHKDAVELNEAYAEGIIDKSLYDLAHNELLRLTDFITRGEFELLELVGAHRDYLCNKIE